jgi:hypothetical protein
MLNEFGCRFIQTLSLVMQNLDKSNQILLLLLHIAICFLHKSLKSPYNDLGFA